jgi:hypothetical protein
MTGAKAAVVKARVVGTVAVLRTGAKVIVVNAAVVGITVTFSVITIVGAKVASDSVALVGVTPNPVTGA